MLTLPASRPAEPFAEAARAGAGPGRAADRRRAALLRLARRQGEVRLQVGDGRGPPPSGAAAVSELLDELNARGLLKYAGLSEGTLRYLPA